MQPTWLKSVYDKISILFPAIKLSADLVDETPAIEHSTADHFTVNSQYHGAVSMLLNHRFTYRNNENKAIGRWHVVV